jgi:hypothetical protein
MMESYVIVILPMGIEGLSALAEWTFFTNSVLVYGVMGGRDRG